jgi:hypothetical protein
VVAPVLAPDERQAKQDVARYTLLAPRDPAFRAALQAAERRLAVVGVMRMLYADVRADKQRVAVAFRSGPICYRRGVAEAAGARCTR